MPFWLQGSNSCPGGPTLTERLSLFLDMRLGVPLPFTGESEVIMIEVVTEEIDGSDRVSCDLKRLRASLGLRMATLQRERKGALFGVPRGVCSKSA